MPVASGCDGCAHRTHDARRKRARAYGALVSAGHAAALRHSRMARDAAAARCRTKKHRLSALLALNTLQVREASLPKLFSRLIMAAALLMPAMTAAFAEDY